MRRIIILVAFLVSALFTKADYLLIPMDKLQTDHLKAYGVAYWVLAQGVEVDWLLNYRGGSFAFRYAKSFVDLMLERGVRYEVISDSKYNQILALLASESNNMDAVKLEKAPKIAVYSPKSNQPWDDAVTLVLTYAEIPYDVLYDEEVYRDSLRKYDWLHLHHEDFTGQYGKFYASYHTQAWYKEQVKENEDIAARLGFSKVSKLKLAVAQKIRDFCYNGGFLFAMCSATDSYDIALAAENTDICDVMYDGDPIDPDCQQKLDYNKCFAFHNFTLELNPYVYEYSDIDVTNTRNIPQDMDYFHLFEFSAKWDPVPTMLCQNHENKIKGFMGQTTAFRKSLIKKDVLIMGELKAADEARYIHGNYGRGMWTFYGGHDPEDYQHFVHEPPTDLSLHKNSAGYRLILNNILFPAARKKKQKT
ncbi:MAG: asparagine synthetase B [Bacteroidia bacterium]|nr:asparagine synthetase B [Bacteroidia bacterium]MDW8157256.1 asparagine synthetase B [Bacteroidia bacterium]